MASEGHKTAFSAIYGADLVYEKDCWRLCGDAYCCSFSRHKAKFRMLGRKTFQELPLLPGEYDFLASNGWLTQFGTHEHRVVEYPIDHRTLLIESLVAYKDSCPCSHDTRTTVCRLYPLLPVFDIHGRLIGTDVSGIYDDLERIDGLKPACELRSVPFDQLNLFLRITTAMAREPVLLFYTMAYQFTKDLVRRALATQKAGNPNKSAFALFEGNFLLRRLVPHEEVKRGLADLADRFEKIYGMEFSLPSTHKSPSQGSASV